jgi:hypothetical protein
MPIAGTVAVRAGGATPTCEQEVIRVLIRGRLPHPVKAGIVAVLAFQIVAACGGSETEHVQFDAGAVLADAAARLDEASSFHFVLSHDSGGTRIIQNMLMTRAEGDVLRPSSIRADLTVTMAGQRIDLRMIGMDDSIWLSNPFDPSRWQLVPDARSEDVLNLQRISDVLTAVEDASADGVATLDGSSSYRIRGSVDSDAFTAVIPEVAVAGETVAVDIWIGRSDVQLRQMVVRGRLNTDEPGDVVRRIILSAFDSPVSIDAPD